MECQVNKPDSTFKTILLCDVCRKNVAHVVCFNSGKENEVRVCKDCMERAMGVFEDDEPKKIPEEKKPEGDCRCHPAKQHRDSVINGLRRDLKKKEDLIKRLKEDLVSTEKAYNNRVEKYIRLSKDNTELTGRVKELVRENTYMKESLGNARENLDFYKNMYGSSEKKRMESVKEYGKLSNGLVKVMIIVALLGIGVGVITTALLMR
uniref:ATP-dependent Clp protease ATP-binding subunit n=1 Tax=Siphoviridae sp. ctt0c4 TaxID=2825702 RepID=A0A8S5V3A6_9CAUD|nr:MAG TPA: ATP-dependent Clp protease ATP-binding subunit [Siphoviridae sp. ctt0c4]